MGTLFQDGTGQTSWGRTGSFIALIASIIWISFIVWQTKTIPSLDGLTLFIVSLYGVSKVSDSFGKSPV